MCKELDLIVFKKTVVGWFNFTVAGVMKYNMNPGMFRKITGISEKAVQGTCEITSKELDTLIAKATYIGLADGWEWLRSDDKGALAQ